MRTAVWIALLFISAPSSTFAQAPPELGELRIIYRDHDAPNGVRYTDTWMRWSLPSGASRTLSLSEGQGTIEVRSADGTVLVYDAQTRRKIERSAMTDPEDAIAAQAFMEALERAAENAIREAPAPSVTVRTGRVVEQGSLPPRLIDGVRTTGWFAVREIANTEGTGELPEIQREERWSSSDGVLLLSEFTYSQGQETTRDTTQYRTRTGVKMPAELWVQSDPDPIR